MNRVTRFGPGDDDDDDEVPIGDPPDDEGDDDEDDEDEDDDEEPLQLATVVHCRMANDRASRHNVAPTTSRGERFWSSDT